MKAHRFGLVVGKFCPLHRGHMHLIQAALDACDEVLVLSYTKPAFPRCDAAQREAWLASLFPAARRLVLDDARLAQACARRGIAPLMPLPANEAPESVHRAFTAWLCWALADCTVDAVFTSEAYGDGLAAALAAHFTDWSGRRMQVVHVSVDPARRAVPVSGTQVRADPQRHRHLLDPVVYASFVDRICILGGESSGKTTLAKALAGALGAALVPEMGRLYWEAKGGRLVYGDMRVIAEAQVEEEERLARATGRWLVCDGSALTTAFYSEDGYGRVDPAVQALAARRYAFCFVCAPDFPFVQDGTRRDAAFRARQHAWYLARLARDRVPHALLEGPVERRVATALALLRPAGEGRASA